MSQRDVKLGIINADTYLIIKGVRRMFFDNILMRSSVDREWWDKNLTGYIDQFKTRHFASYSISYIKRERVWERDDGRKTPMLSLVVYREGYLVPAERLLELVCKKGREPEETHEMGILLGYAPELVQEFCYGEI